MPSSVRVFSFLVFPTDKISRLVSHYSPTIYCWRGWSVVIYRTPFESESYSLIHPDSDGLVTCVSGGAIGESEASGIRHMLTNARGEGDFELPKWLPKSSARWLQC